MVIVALQLLNFLNREFSLIEGGRSQLVHLANGREGADVVAGQVG